MSAELTELVRSLARARAGEAAAQTAMQEAKRAMTESEFGSAYAAAQSAYGSAAQRRETREAALRDAMRQGQTDPDHGRKWAWGGQNKKKTRLVYADDKALAYCREHLPQALRLDGKKFEQAAAVLGLDFVTVEPDWTPTIPQDLGAWAGEEDNG